MSMQVYKAWTLHLSLGLGALFFLSKVLYSHNLGFTIKTAKCINMIVFNVLSYLFGWIPGLVCMRGLRSNQ